MPVEAQKKVKETLKQELDPGCMTEISKKQVFIIKRLGMGRASSST